MWYCVFFFQFSLLFTRLRCAGGTKGGADCAKTLTGCESTLTGPVTIVADVICAGAAAAAVVTRDGVAFDGEGFEEEAADGASTVTTPDCGVVSPEEGGVELEELVC